jgi:hypothetical protein
MSIARGSAITFCTCISLGFTMAAHAALIDRGGGLIYDADRNITWLSDANYGAGSAFDDGFSTTDGLMTWQNAVNWASDLSYYDSVRGVTYTDWRLPSTLQPDASCADQHGGGFSSGANCTGSEMGHVFYNELSGTAFSSIADSTDPDLSLFTNIQLDGYWSGSDFDATDAEVFNHRYGLQGPDQKILGYGAWAVRDGDVSAVPAPGAAWLLATGLVALVGRARRRLS